MAFFPRLRDLAFAAFVSRWFGWLLRALLACTVLWWAWIAVMGAGYVRLTAAGEAALFTYYLWIDLRPFRERQEHLRERTADVPNRHGSPPPRWDRRNDREAPTAAWRRAVLATAFSFAIAGALVTLIGVCVTRVLRCDALDASFLSGGAWFAIVLFTERRYRAARAPGRLAPAHRPENPES